MMSSDEDDFEISDTEDQVKPENKFLSVEELRSEMNEAIADVQSVIQVKTGECRILLQKYKWSKDSLLERFYDSPDATDFLIAAHVLPQSSNPPQPKKTAECQICFEMEEIGEVLCNHQACKNCWDGYLTEKIRDGGQCEIKCMMPDCPLILDDETIHKYVTNPEVLTIYDRLIVDSYVKSCIFLKWCPGVNCGKAVKVPDCDRHIVNCPCGMLFCSSCGNDTHEPISCALLKAWLIRQKDDTETAHWIQAHTKDCPKCHVAIEKNQGCNHMTCRSCHHEFCWLCLGNWKGHKDCNRFDAEEVKRAVSRVSLQRYLFYSTRYHEHLKSLEMEKKLIENVAFKTRQLATNATGWIDAQYLNKAVEVLSASRRTLMYTFAFAFYLERDNNAAIFESNQADLQLATENLSRILETDLEADQVDCLKTMIQDNYRYVESRRQVLLDHCEEGVNQGFWKYNTRIV